MNLDGSAPDFDSLFEYLDGVLGDSNVLRVVVELINVEPYWQIIHFVDSDGKQIDL